ncbi:neurotactin-like [Ischnura elegans]|uniref:neurotactin-like n=1 Tax=Ischnura elegans TaxID=197161 RepID=UPI001ED89154|nr:neurotactin-like [Ischnura elegans]
MVGRGYDLRGGGRAEAERDKRRPQVATEADDGVEPLNVHRYAICAADSIGSQESLRAALATGIKKRRRCSERVNGWLSMHGLIIGKVLLFLLLLTATAVVTALSARASNQRSAAAARGEEESTFLLLDTESGSAAIAYTSCGPVQGWAQDGAFSFRGIPYALPPEGPLRWRPPHPLNQLHYCWNGTLKTLKSAPNACWQTYRNGSLDGAEDCLTLDVFAPRAPRGQRAPVVVLAAAETLAGGGGRGADSPPLLSASLAGRTGVVFVRVRFRLGVLGFLTSPNAATGGGGNHGLADLRLALLWVRANSAAFGGNPDDVTLLGHRAGASLALALSADRKPPFAKLWLSGPGLILRPLRPHETRPPGAFLAEAGLDCGEDEEEECWRALDAEDLVEATPEHWKWRPVDLPAPDEESLSHGWLTVDGRVLMRSPLDAWEREGVQVPTVIGTTSHGESTAELFQRRDWNADGAVREHVQGSALGSAGVHAMSLYDNWTLGADSPVARLAAVITDIRSICPLLSMARMASTSKASKASLYFYVAEASPGEAGTPGEPIGPGDDLSQILVHPTSRPEEKYGPVAQLFYAYVRHSFSESGELWAPAPWSRVPAMPHRVLLTRRDGRVDARSSLYHACDTWERYGFVDWKFARTD